MRLTVRDERKQFTQQTYAYAEYRAFSSLIGADDPVEDVTITLSRRPLAAAMEDAKVVCTIAVRMASGEAAEVQAVDRHAYGAIDRAVVLIGRLAPAAAPVRTPTAPGERESA